MSGRLARQAGRGKLPRAARLRVSREIRRIVRRGWRYRAGPYVVHGVSAPGSGGSRLTVVVPRRVGNQANRNRVKRIFREAFRLKRADWDSDWDLVVYVRSTPSKPTLEEAAGLLTDAVAALAGKPRKEHKDT